MVHVTTETLDRMRRRELPAPEVLAAMRHIGDCAECAALGERLVSGEVSAFREELALEAPPRPQWRWWLLAAACLAAAILLAIRLVPRRTAEPVLVERRPPVRETVPQHPAALTRAPEMQRLVEGVIANGKLPFPADLALIERGADVLRGGTASGAPRMSPSGVVIDDARPRFTWSAVADTAIVSVYDGETRIAQSEPLRGREWRPRRELPRGRTYAWEVELRTNDGSDVIPKPPAPPAVFRIVSDSEHHQLREARETHGDDPLLLAVLFARSGMRAEAEAELRRVPNPPFPP